MEQLSIKDAAKQLGVEAHVLRYWEDELELDIKRNSQGHRYYDERDIRLFRKVQELKEEGYALKDVRLAIRKARGMEVAESDVKTEHEEKPVAEPARDLPQKTQTEPATAEKVVDFKQAQLQALMNKVVGNAFRENKDLLMQSIKEEVTADVMKQFDAVMREKEEREEARYRKLDGVLRQLQQANLEVAATKQKKRFWFRG